MRFHIRLVFYGLVAAAAVVCALGGLIADETGALYGTTAPAALFLTLPHAILFSLAAAPSLS